MKTKKHQKTIHQHVERLLSHRISVVIVLFLMIMGVSSFDNRVRTLLQEAYTQGWGWVGAYMTHEHPAHTHTALNTVRVHTVSGPG
ncbi:MAG TPA: hypothetical protein VFM05_05540 [Candidatus Saccharimonadales bacterium]|nr:hypothetical protein [Candidatus Saccharimonadales bacterium]